MKIVQLEKWKNKYKVLKKIIKWIVFLMALSLLYKFMAAKKKIATNQINEKSIEKANDYNKGKCKRKYCRSMSDQSCVNNEKYNKCLDRLNKQIK